MNGPHHDGSGRYVSTLAPALGETVSVLVRVPAGDPANAVWVRSTPDGEPRFGAAVVDRTTPTERWWRAEVEVRNPVTGYRFLLRDAAGGYRWLTAAGLVAHDVPDATDFRLVAGDPPPAWNRDAVVYEIFPDRYARSVVARSRELPDWAVACDWDTPVAARGPQTPYQVYRGDLDGVVDRLDHVAALGANAVYLTPVFPARSNHRYDAVDFDRVDPLLGGEPALRRLAAAVHGRGWRLVGDLTTNHCGDGHPWFVAARSSVDAPERKMFHFFADGGGYESWLGVGSLPKLNWGSARLRHRFLKGPAASAAGPTTSAAGGADRTGSAGVAVRWLDVFDGWRVDVANMTGRCRGDDHAHEVARMMRAAVARTRPDGLLVAEHAHDASGDLDIGGWHATMSYAGFTRPVWSWLRADDLDLPDLIGVPGGVPRVTGGAAVATMRAFAARVSWRSLTHSWTLLGSHDTARIRTVVGTAARHEVAAGLLLTMPGTPMVFAGDELGLTGTNGEGSRTPMPWHRRKAWDTAHLDRYRALVALRRGCPALREGGLRWLHVDDEVLVYARETAQETVLVQARRGSGQPVRLPVDAPAGTGPAGAAEPLYGDQTLRLDRDGCVQLPGDGPSFGVWRLPSA
ncbi:MAG TPA: glycoside hydrolase family 13 protein [Micromonosporaceae bacterium]|nr:glycoside hydrolase family 13 protein [Micromonosporaceae bacterium]